MKRFLGLLLVVFCSSVLLQAQDIKGKEMTGWICNSKCVTHDAGQTACNENCNDQSGDVVFVSENGTITKIANPEIGQGKMGKKIKCHGEMMKEGTVMIYDPVLANAG